MDSTIVDTNSLAVIHEGVGHGYTSYWSTIDERKTRQGLPTGSACDDIFNMNSSSGWRISARLRLLSLGDQALFSASNFVITIAIARLFPSDDLAAYGIGMTIAVTAQQLQRSTFVVPITLLNSARFYRRRAGLIAQNIVLFGFASSIVVLTFAILMLSNTVHTQAYIYASVSCTAIYFSVDFDRVLLLKSGRQATPFTLSLCYFFTTIGLAILAFLQAISFSDILLVQALFGVVKTSTIASLTAWPSFHKAIKLLMHNFRANFGWAAICTLSSIGYSDLPLFILAASGSALATAAYVAVRSPLQPMLIVVRSLDIVDKVRFGNVTRMSVGDASERFWRLLRQYFLGSVTFATIAAIYSRPLINLFIGPKYLQFGLTLSLWAAIFVVATTLLPLETIIYREKRIRAFAFVQVIAGIIGGCASIPLSYYFSTPGAVSACLLGWVVVIFASWVFIVRPLVGSGTGVSEDGLPQRFPPMW